MTFDIYLGLSILSFSLFLFMIYIYFQLKTKYELLEDDNRDASERIKNLELQYAVLQTRYEEEKKTSSQKLSLLQGAKDELSNEFKTLANKIFEDKSKQFSTRSKEQLELMLQPFREQITNFSTQTKEQFLTHSKETYLLKDELPAFKTDERPTLK
ncbi:MAG: hypothetical protein Q9M40_11305 [Sulfurimonas sp.]|nr:hypothetical protein [Sulfurimonas sp.]